MLLAMSPFLVATPILRGHLYTGETSKNRHHKHHWNKSLISYPGNNIRRASLGEGSGKEEGMGYMVNP